MSKYQETVVGKRNMFNKSYFGQEICGEKTSNTLVYAYSYTYINIFNLD